MIGEMQAGVFYVFRSGGDGVFDVAGIRGNRELPHMAGHGLFKFARGGAGAEAIVHYGCGGGDEQADHDDQKHKKCGAALHGMLYG